MELFIYITATPYILELCNVLCYLILFSVTALIDSERL